MRHLRTGIGAAVVGLAFGGGCSGSGGGSDGGGGGGSCAMVDVCGTLPLATVNSSLGVMATATQAQNTAPAGLADRADLCDYVTGGKMPASAGHYCFSSAMLAAQAWQSERDKMPVTGQTLKDVAGVGDKAYLSTSTSPGAPPMVDGMELRAVRGSVLVVLHAAVDTASPAMVEQGLTSLATTLLAK